MAEQLWRVVGHERDASGVWTLQPERYGSEREAEQAAARACTAEGGCSNAGAYLEVDGVVQVPPWMTVRDADGRREAEGSRLTLAARRRVQLERARATYPPLRRLLDFVLSEPEGES